MRASIVRRFQGFFKNREILMPWTLKIPLFLCHYIKKNSTNCKKSDAAKYFGLQNAKNWYTRKNCCFTVPSPIPLPPQKLTNWMSFRGCHALTKDIYFLWFYIGKKSFLSWYCRTGLSSLRKVAWPLIHRMNHCHLSRLPDSVIEIKQIKCI